MIPIPTSYFEKTSKCRGGLFCLVGRLVRPSRRKPAAKLDVARGPDA